MTTTTGNLILFRHNLVTRRKKPAKPAHTLTLASEAEAGGGGKEVAKQITVLGSRLADQEDPRVTIAYGYVYYLARY